MTDFGISGGGPSFSTDPADYDDDLSAFGGPGDPDYSVGGSETYDVQNAPSDLERFRAWAYSVLTLGSGAVATTPVIGGMWTAYEVERSPVPNGELYQHHVGQHEYLSMHPLVHEEMQSRLREEGIALDTQNRADIHRAYEIQNEIWGGLLREDAPGITPRNPSPGAIDAVIETTHAGSVQPRSFVEGIIAPAGFTGAALVAGTAPAEVRAAVNDLFSRAGAVEIPRPDGGSEWSFQTSAGRFVPASQVVNNLARVVSSGGTLGPNQLAIVQAMTPAQRQAAGIFLRPNGEVIPFADVLTRAVQNAAAGEPLTLNQKAALGLVFQSTPNVGGAHRDLVNQLAGSAGSEVRANISAAVQESLRTAIDIRQTARAQTEASQRGTPARVAQNAIGRLQAGQGLTANQQQLFERLTRGEQAALLDQALAPRGKPNIVANIIARTANGQAPNAAQREFLASLPPQQRTLIRTTAERAAAPGAIRQTPAAAQRALTVATERAVAARAPVAAVAPRNMAAPLRDLPQAQQQAVLLQRAVQRRQAGVALTPLQRTALAQSTAAERRPLAAQAQAATAARAAQAAAARNLAAAEKVAAARTTAQRAKAEAQAVAQRKAAAAAQRAAETAQRAAAARVAQQAAAARAKAAKAPIAAVAPRNMAAPLKTLSAAEQQRVLATRAASRTAAGIALTTKQREAAAKSTAAERARLAQQAQAAQRAKAQQQAARERANQLAKRAAAQKAAAERAKRAAAAKAAEAARRAAVQRAARQAEQRAAAARKAAAASAARKKAVAPKNMPTKLKNLSAAEQRRVLLTRAVARRQAGKKLTAAQLAALKASTAKQRKAVR